MGRSSRVRANEVRAAVRLAWECVESGDDPDGWRSHLTAGLVRLTNAGCLVTVEYRPGGPRGFTLVDNRMYGGESATAAARFAEWSRRPDPPEHVALTRFLSHAGAVLVQSGRELLSDVEWEVDAYRNDFLRPLGLGDGVMARSPVGDGVMLAISPVRFRGEPRFDRRERRLVELIHTELVPHLGRRLATSGDPVARLAPRQREVLGCLLDGDSEKQVAARLGLAVGTVHGHVKLLYRHFGVGSRAELLASFLRRYRRPKG